eukprot:TRINITY_DN31562_c0_g1_i1.p1 TRINITY_DN31562_c0_g1~~TRINITY_DN31562_c0_g1_i1.p1  ORF type:complete len:455 (+),score=97.98 TRINITY_DN31562_c0_g1_i1:57-1421(+)
MSASTANGTETGERLIEAFRRRDEGKSPVIDSECLIKIVKYLDPTLSEESLIDLLSAAGQPDLASIDYEQLIRWLFPEPNKDSREGMLSGHFSSSAFLAGKLMETDETEYSIGVVGGTGAYSHSSGVGTWRDALLLSPAGEDGSKVLYCYVSPEVLGSVAGEAFISAEAWAQLQSSCYGVADPDIVACELEPRELAAAPAEVKEEVLSGGRTACLPLVVSETRISTSHSERAPCLRRIQCGAASVEVEALANNVERRARGIFEQTKEREGEKHPSTLAAMNDLAFLLEARETPAALQEAVRLCRQAFEEFENLHGPKHPSTLTGASNLAFLLEKVGEMDEAEKLARRSYNSRDQVLGETHPDTMTSLYNLAMLLEARGKIQESHELFQSEQRLCVAAYGPKHPDTLESISRLQDFERVHGDHLKGNKANAEGEKKQRKKAGAKDKKRFATFSGS